MNEGKSFGAELRADPNFPPEIRDDLVIPDEPKEPQIDRSTCPSLWQKCWPHVCWFISILAILCLVYLFAQWLAGNST